MGTKQIVFAADELIEDVAKDVKVIGDSTFRKHTIRYSPAKNSDKILKIKAPQLKIS